MFLIAKLHPNLEETEKGDYNGPWLSKASKKEIIQRFYANRQDIPLCIDHRDTGKTGHVKDANRVGRVCDLFLNNTGELMVKCELFNHHRDGYREVNQGIFRDKTRWGVSVGLTNVSDKQGKKRSRNLVHVALTSDPAFAAKGTYISHWGLDEKAVNRALVREYGDGYFSEALRAKLEADTGNRRLSTMATEQHTQQEVCMEVDNRGEAEQEQPKPKPLTIKEKQATLARMHQHMKDAGCDFLAMDLPFRRDYVKLEEEIAKDVEDENTYLSEVCIKRNVPAASRELLFKLLNCTEADAPPPSHQIQQTLVDFVGANAEHYRQAEGRERQLTVERDQLAQENMLMKKQMEQESFNAQNKRSRPLHSGSFAFNASAVSHAPVKPQQQQQQQQQTQLVSPSSTRSAPTMYSYTEDVKVHARTPIVNEKLSQFVFSDTQSNGYQRQTPYTTTSATEYAAWNRLDQMCNSVQLKKQ